MARSQIPHHKFQVFSSYNYYSFTFTATPNTGMPDNYSENDFLTYFNDVKKGISSRLRKVFLYTGIAAFLSLSSIPFWYNESALERRVSELEAKEELLDEVQNDYEDFGENFESSFWLPNRYKDKKAYVDSIAQVYSVYPFKSELAKVKGELYKAYSSGYAQEVLPEKIGWVAASSVFGASLLVLGLSYWKSRFYNYEIDNLKTRLYNPKNWNELDVL